MLDVLNKSNLPNMLSRCLYKLVDYCLTHFLNLIHCSTNYLYPRTTVVSLLLQVSPHGYLIVMEYNMFISHCVGRSKSTTSNMGTWVCTLLQVHKTVRFLGWEITNL